MAAFASVQYAGGKNPAKYGVLGATLAPKKPPTTAAYNPYGTSLSSVLLNGAQVGAAPASQASSVAGVTAPVMAQQTGALTIPKLPSLGGTGLNTSVPTLNLPAGLVDSGGNSITGSSIATMMQADPFLQQAEALAQQQVSQAQNAAATAAQRELIGYGDFTGGAQSVSSLLGQGLLDSSLGGVLGDQATLATARANPDSTLSLLGQEHVANNGKIDETDNAANLFYGSKHANDLGSEVGAYGARQRQAATSLANALSGLNSNVLAARTAAQGQISQAELDAFQRALSLAQLLGGTSPSNPNPTPTTPTTPTSPNASQYATPGVYTTPSPYQTYLPAFNPAPGWYGRPNAPAGSYLVGLPGGIVG